MSGILRIVEEEARKHDATRIVAVKLDVGLLACVEEQTLAGCFEIFAEGTLAENARLDIRRVPLDCRCKECGHAFTLEKRSFTCPNCDGREISFTGGHGCAISAIEVSGADVH